jgi:hypothetical protein
MSAFNDDVTLPRSVSDALAAIPKQQLDAAIAQVNNAIPTDNSQLTNGRGYLTSHQSLSAYAKESQLFSGNYGDLSNTPVVLDHISWDGYNNQIKFDHQVQIPSQINFGLLPNQQHIRADYELRFENSQGVGMTLAGGDLSLDGGLSAAALASSSDLIIADAMRLVTSGSTVYLETGQSTSDTDAELIVSRWKTLDSPIKAFNVYANSIGLHGATTFQSVNWSGSADNITESGFYRVNDDPNFDLIIHIQHPSSSGYALQLGSTSYSSPHIEARVKTAGTWGSPSNLN